MKPFITSASKTKCRLCGGSAFKLQEVPGFENKIPVCKSCSGYPRLFRVVFNAPIIGTEEIKKQEKTKDHKGRRLDSPSKADAFCEYVKEKMKLDGDNFDPREIGSVKEQGAFKIANNSVLYIKDQKDRRDRGEITPGGYRKKERVWRLYIRPIFGKYTVKQLDYQLVHRELSKSSLSDPQKIEVIAELNVFQSWLNREGLLRHKIELPPKPKLKKIDPKKLYTLEERDLVINNIKDPGIRTAVIILAVYTRRMGEVRALRWGDVDFKNGTITFCRHESDGGRKELSREIDGLKSSKDKILVYEFFPGLRELLIAQHPSLDKNEPIFKSVKGKKLPKNAIYNEWKKSALDLIERKKLKKYCDLHRGTRSSTLTALNKQGHFSPALAELYGGDERTLKDFYIRKTGQNTEGLLTSDGLIKKGGK